MSRFDHARGTPDQVWIAGGVGVAPFLSWMRALDEHPTSSRLDLYYAFTAGPAPFAEELTAVGAAHPSVRVHLVDSVVDGRRTARILDESVVESFRLSVLLCDPEAMWQELKRGLREGGAQSRNNHREYFDWR